MENLTLEGQILLQLVLARVKRGDATYDIYKDLAIEDLSYMEEIASLLAHKHNKR